MGSGLLESLRKYRPREGKDPLENFITEAFGWILNNYSNFGEFFLNEISSRVQISGMDGKNCEPVGWGEARTPTETRCYNFG